MKIKSLQFYDYRAFYSASEADKMDYFIEVDRKNLLVYGENGSGKTSLFNGLKDIILGNDFISHFQTPLLNAGFVEIAFDDNTKDRFDHATKATKAELLGISKLNSFLSYKELLKAHLYDDVEINFFETIVNVILREHKLQTLGPLQSSWEKIISRDLSDEAEIILAGLPGDLTQDEATEQIERLNPDYLTQITEFKDEFDVLLRTINTGINEILNYFNQGVTIEFELTPLTLENIKTPELKAKVNYANQGIQEFHKFLNEAKLSAIAISIYLTALKSNPAKGAIKLLCLDDIFLGLDLSNRLPLLDILKANFSEWQIFLTTYDRHWFEVAKQHLNDDWKAIEMYATKVEEKLFDKPLIIQSNDYFIKAKNYFSAGDYPASLNYLRKELEAQIKARLPEESTRQCEGRPHQLVHLWDLLVERYNRNNQGHLITTKISDELQIARFSLLNPQSHDNLSAPVYKYELQRAIGLIKDIQAIPIIKGITLLSSGMELVFKHSQVDYSMTLELLEDWQMDIVGEIKTHKYPNCKLKYWQFNGNDYFNTHNNTLGGKPNKLPENKLNKIRSNIIAQALLQPLTEDSFNKNTTFESIWTIKELIENSENQKSDNWFCRIFKRK